MITALKNCIEIIETGKREKGGAVSAGIPSVGAEHLQNDGRVNWAKQSMKYISEDFFSKMKTGKIQPYDVLLVKDGATTGKVAYVDDVPQCGAAINEHVFLMRPKDNLLPKYLYFYLHSPIGKNNVLHFFRGAAIGGISRDFLNAEIKLPSIPVQEEIIRKLSCIDEVIQMCQQMKQEYDNLIKSRFVEMFGDPVLNSMGWEVKKLKDLSHKISDGVHAKPKYTDEGKPFISVVNINTGNIDFSNCKFVSEADYEKMIKSTHPEKGDVLYTKVGATYGIPAYVDTDEDFCLYVSVCLIKPKHELVNARFLTESMRLPYIKHQADRRIRGIGVPDLHLNQIREFDILCPPIDLQERYIEFVELANKSKLIIDDLIAENEILRTDVMQQYFV